MNDNQQPKLNKPGLILWASRTGRTLQVCQTVEQVLTEAGIAVEMISAAEYQEDPRDRPFLITASPTYGVGDLHPLWDRLEREWRQWDFKGLPAAALGCGSSRYPVPCGAVEILETRLRNQGAKILLPALKVDTLTGLDLTLAEAWAHKFIQALGIL
ncbi:MAG: flavodoxin-like domain-containing protein [Spirochaetales bacterium]|nr:flavodoxin-like domain-containing protein [Spirochaetales bacterium]